MVSNIIGLCVKNVMKKIEIDFDNDIEIDEFQKVIGFVSQDILDYDCNEKCINICLNETSNVDEIVNEIKKISRKYISNRKIEKSIYHSNYKKDIYYSNFETTHYFDDGMVSFSKQSQFLYHYFDEKFEKFVQQSFHGTDCDIIMKIYPVLLPINAYEKTGYLKRTPQYSIFCCSLCEDIKLLNQIGMLKESNYSKVINNPSYSLSPSACFHVYEEYKDKIINKNTIITFTQSVFRNEGRFNFREFGRMRDYHVREIVFIGDPQFVEMARKKIIDITKEFIEKIKLDAKITIASDPFILPRMQKYKKMQVIDNSKYELRLTYDQSHDMSVASFNIHGTAFTQPFNISVLDKDTITGCIGYGLERFVLCFLSQFGENVSNWPSDIRDEYESVENL